MRNVIEKSNDNLVIVDTFSRLLQARIVFIDGGIDEDMANSTIAQLLYLDSISNKEINVYINSTGGLVTQGLAIYDIGKIIKSPIRTVAMGQAASMACILMLMGEVRVATPNSRLMLHQIAGGVVGTQEDIRVQVAEMEVLEKLLYDIVKEKTLITNPETELRVDNWYSPTRALELGILTEIL